MNAVRKTKFNNKRSPFRAFFKFLSSSSSSTKISAEKEKNNGGGAAKFSGAAAGGDTTHFGFETVSEAEKSQKVYKVFENVATTYDLMNDLMSGGVHRFWKDYFMEKLSPTANTKLIDVAGGTGDIAFRFLKNAQLAPKSADGTYHVTVVDINKSMLEVGRQRCKNLHIDDSKTSWIEADAENLPFENEKFDAYTIAFGIRNCTHVDKVLNEAFRILKPGGRFLCLEFSQVKSPILSKLYDAYSFNVIPAMGYLIAKDWNSYQYLVESIRKFPNQQEFAWMIEDAGFSNVSFENLNFGVCAVHSGFKF